MPDENIKNIKGININRKCLGHEIRLLRPEEYPFLLRQLTKQPKKLYVCGSIPADDDHKFLCVIGSRSHSQYGREICKQIILGLRGSPVVIISGMAIGMDSLAHEFALEAGLKTIAMPGSGLLESVLYPSSKMELAKRILESGGAIMSPFHLEQGGDGWTFPVRNALMAGCSHAVLMIEARKDSGTLITADKALDFNRDLFAVPGSVFSDLSSGTNMKLREGAIAVTSAEDVLESLGIARTEIPKLQSDFDMTTLEKDERRLLDHLSYPKMRDELINEIHIDAADLSAIISSLEMKGAVLDEDGFITKIWK